MASRPLTSDEILRTLSDIDSEISELSDESDIDDIGNCLVHDSSSGEEQEVLEEETFDNEDDDNHEDDNDNFSSEDDNEDENLILENYREKFVRKYHGQDEQDEMDQCGRSEASNVRVGSQRKACQVQKSWDSNSSLTNDNSHDELNYLSNNQELSTANNDSHEDQNYQPNNQELQYDNVMLTHGKDSHLNNKGRSSGCRNGGTSTSLEDVDISLNVSRGIGNRRGRPRGRIRGGRQGRGGRSWTGAWAGRKGKTWA